VLICMLCMYSPLFVAAYVTVCVHSMHYFTVSVPGLHNDLSLLSLGDVVNATTVYIRIGTETTLDIPTPRLSLEAGHSQSECR